MPAKKTASKSKVKRLTEKQREAIGNAPADVSNTELAKKYKTSLQTVSKYRRPRAMPKVTGTKKRGRPRRSISKVAGNAGIKMEVEGDEIVLRIPKKNLLKGLVDELLQ